MKVQNPTGLLRPILAALLPLVAFILQWMFWPYIQPYVWFLFYPAVFFSSWIGGLSGGLVATVISAPLVMYYFMPPQFSFAVEYPRGFLSAGVFVTMGLLFGYTQERVRKANRETVEALAATRSANDQLETRVRERTAELAQTSVLVQASEARYRSALDNMLEGCQIIGFDWRYLYLNDVADQHNRRPKEELLGKKYMDMWPGIESTEVFVVIRRCMEERVPQSMENEFTFPDGSQGWFELRIYPVPEGIVIHSINITERKRVEERFRLIVEAAPGAMIVVDREGMMKLVNARAQELFGYRQEALLGHPVEMLVPERLRGGHLEYRQGFFTQATARPMGAGRDLFGLRKDGREVPVEIGLSPVETPEGLLTLALIVDITERKRSEEALQESQQLFYKIFHSSPTAMVLSRLSDGRFVDANESFLKLTGYPLDEVVGLTSTEAGITADPKAREERLAALKQDGQLPGFEVEVIRKSGELRNGLASVGTVSFKGEQFALSNFLDITERKQAEAALQKAHAELEFKVQERTAALSQANALLQTMMDHLPDQIYFKDAQSRFIRNSRSQAELMGLSDPAEVVGKTDFDFFPHAQRSYDEEQALMRSGRPLIDLEEYVVWPDGRATWVSTTKAPWRDKEGQIIGTFGISRDITERKRAEQAIRQLNADLQEKAAQLEAANKELEAFSYSVSHDLRAPLRGIDGWSLALLEDYGDALDQQGRQYLDRVRSETQRMGRLIDDMLQLSRVTRAEMRQELVNLSALAQALAARLQETEPARPVEFSIQAGLSARGDASLLEAVLSNLLNNAFKFTGRTPQARIEFGQTEIQGERAFFVRDNGAGFDMLYAQKLFGAFQRLHKATEFPGTGVGLAIVQRVIHRHGGRVWTEAGVNQGATFYFTLEEVA